MKKRYYPSAIDYTLSLRFKDDKWKNIILRNSEIIFESESLYEAKMFLAEIRAKVGYPIEGDPELCQKNK